MNEEEVEEEIGKRRKQSKKRRDSPLAAPIVHWRRQCEVVCLREPSCPWASWDADNGDLEERGMKRLISHLRSECGQIF